MRSGLDTAASSRFRIVGPLGTGAFGAVFEAVDLRSREPVALKQLADISAESLARFKHEFRALADCHHANLVSLKELIEHEGRWFIVMELVPGSDLRSYLRRDAPEPDGPHFDEVRVRSALLGMARGLLALHGHGILHRDLKPGNVRVTPEGRAVLLDFGLATSIDPTQQPSGAALVGTAAYMAPEQSQRDAVGPPADWYAFGVCLFEALTGRRPFEAESADSAFQLLRDKRRLPAPRASSFEPLVPSDLDALCASLLETDPARRAGAKDVLRVLGDEQELDKLFAQFSAAPQAPFAGREAELRHLEHALARTHAGELRVVLVEGESGVGKSELVNEFLRAAREANPQLIKLQGRCYENEQVAYKAFDGCIDELSRLLQRMPEHDCAMLLPPRAALLAQLFPVLRTLDAVAKAPRGEPSADPIARRLEAFSALAALLSRLAEERPLVLVVDDLQWADAESFRLLQALAEHPEPPPVLVLATIRPWDELEPEVAAQLETLRRRKQVELLPLLGLPPAQAEALAAKLLGPDAPPKWPATIAAESAGHPLFLSELARFAQSHESGAHGGLSLEAALRARIEQLDERARELLELVALAARPHGGHTFANALSAASIEEPARALLAARLLRLRKGRELGCYHDRIRHAAVALIARGRLGSLHRQLASALAADREADPTEQARHWDLAGELEPAVAAYEDAAERALAALAFDRSAQLCARAIELVGDERDPRWQRLIAQRAYALACAGRSAEAAVLYERATERASGDERLKLRGRYAQQLVLAGKFELGFATARAVLAQLGLGLPAGAGAALLEIAWYGLWLAVRGIDFKTRAPRAQDEARHALAIELIETFRNTFAPFHPTALVSLTLRCVRTAAAFPDPQAVALAYGALGWFRCLRGSLPAALRLFDKSRKLCGELDQPLLSARNEYVEGSARLMGFDWVGAGACFERAQTLLQRHCPDQPSLLTNTRFHLGVVWYHLGQHGRIARETEHWLAEARERNDQLAVALLTGLGHGFLRHLQRDDPEQALRDLDDALRAMPASAFSFVHYGHLLAMSISLFYRGGAGAQQWLESQRPTHARALLLRSRLGRETLEIFRCLAALHAHESASPEQRPLLRASARRGARRLARGRSPFTKVYARLIQAQVCVLEDKLEAALREARVARQLSSGSPHFTARTSAYLEALLEAGHAHDPRCEQVVAFLREQGWREPLRFLRVALPAFSQLPARRLGASERELLLRRYQLVRPLGGGGSGSVFEARDVLTGRTLAIKERVASDGRSLERFKQEFRALADRHHANLVRLDALFEHASAWYIAMELVDGPDLIAYARPHGELDPERLCAAFAGAVEGLSALHEAGFVHRDLKPGNVRVTADGRAVLLDSSWIAQAGDAAQPGTAGTLGYAAPEQLAGARPSASADVYALGTCLYQALSGQLPFSAETPAQWLREKRSAKPRPLNVRGLGSLGALALRMLARDPHERPALSELRAALRAEDAEAPLAPTDAPRAHFTGRERELAQLAETFERTCDDGLILALMEGESGIGKSALIGEFGRRIEASFPRLLVLKGRCYQNEQIAFKAFDGAVDGLAQALRALPNPVCEALLPKRASLLGELFPVLTSVEAIAQASKKGLPADPAVRELAAVSCFVELLELLGRRFELLFLLEDLQWADSESFRILRLLLARRESLPFLFVCSVRPAHEIDAEVTAELERLSASSGVEPMALEGLCADDAASLACELFGAPLPSELVVRVVRESKGHPLFLRELIESARRGAPSITAPTLDQALAARIQSLDADAQGLLSLVALADKPYGTHVYARASARREPSRAALVALLGRGLLRRSGDDQLVCYHDRIRRVALELLAPAQKQALARALAESLDAERAGDPAERARLWELAGEREKARDAYEQAGDGALSGLAFARAAQHFLHALEFSGATRDERACELLARRGEALARLGQSAEAARAFEQAAAGAHGERALRLRIWASQHLIQSGQVAEGMRAARALLAELDMALPRGRGAALLRLAWDGGVLAVRGLALKPRRGELSARTRMQLEAAWSLSSALVWIDPLAVAAVSKRHLRVALAAGEPAQLARALSVEAFTRALRDPEDSASDHLLARARSLCAEHPDPELEATLTFREGAVAALRWHLAAAGEHLEQALQIVTERCPHQPWLLSNIRNTLGAVWVNRAEHRRFSAASRAWIAEARAQNDKFALTMLSGLGYGFLPHLMADQPDLARAELECCLEPWPAEPFSFAQLGELIGHSYERLYRGGAAALEWHARELPRLARAPLLQTGMARSVFLHFRALALLSAWTVASQREAPPLLAEARATVRKLSRVRAAFAGLAAPFLEAQIEAAEGRVERALALAHEVDQKAEDSAYTTLAHRARYLEALLRGDEASEQTRAGLLAFYAEQGWQNPRRAISMWCPVLDALEARGGQCSVSAGGG